MAPGDEEHIPIAKIKALDKENTNWTRQPDYKFFIGFDFYPVNNWQFHDPEYYPLFGGKYIKYIYGFFFN